MTIDDVMKEFGIDCVPDGDPATVWYARTPIRGDCVASAEGATPSDAVCALLKARYGMTADIVKEIGGMEVVTTVWIAQTPERQWAAQPTELAAVVALARRIRGAG